MAEIRWDYEQISSFVDQLEACIDVLKDQQTFLKRFQADAAGSWASEAGQLYGERLDVDIEEIGNAVRTFESARNQLRQTVRTYAGGELNTINRLNWHYYNRLSVR